MALKDEISYTEILNRIPVDLQPADLTQAKVEGIRDQICGWIEDFTATTFSASSTFFNTAKLLAINYSAALCVAYSGANPEVNASFSPDGQLKVSLTSMPKAVASFIKLCLNLAAFQLQLLQSTAANDLPSSNVMALEG